MAQNGPAPGDSGNFGEKRIRRVQVELNLEEARTFVGKLREIEKEMIAANQ